MQERAESRHAPDSIQRLIDGEHERERGRAKKAVPIAVNRTALSARYCIYTAIALFAASGTMVVRRNIFIWLENSAKAGNAATIDSAMAMSGTSESKVVKVRLPATCVQLSLHEAGENVGGEIQKPRGFHELSGCLIGLRKELNAPLSDNILPLATTRIVFRPASLAPARVGALQLAVKLVEGAETGFRGGDHNVGIGPVPVDDAP